MLIPGLVSITFRQLTPEEIIALVARAGGKAIEWGGDVHVPHGDVATAEKVGKLTREAGLAISAYGSYYRTAVSEADGLAFDDVLASAVALGAPIIRVWAGNKGSAEADAAYRQAVIEDSRRIGDMAAAKGIKIAYEYHGNTLTDVDESALELLAEINHPNVGTFWQPHNEDDDPTRMAGLKAIIDQVVNAHVFFWENYQTRFALADGKDMWLPYLKELAATGRDHYLCVEFVQNDEPENYVRDAKTLQEWIDLVE